MNYRKTIGSQCFRLIIPIIFSFILLITFPASAQEGTLKWSIDIGVEGKGISSPVVGADGTIYIESGGDLYAINFDGTQKWVLAGAGTPQVIGDDGTIYAGSLHAINPDGTQKWELIGVGDPQSIGADGTIYTIESSDEPSLYAINPDGTQKWVSHPPSLSDDPLERRFSDAIVGADGTIYLVGLEEHWFFLYYCQCGLFAINSDGTQKWIVEGESAGGGECIVRAPAIGYDGTIYATMGAWGMGLFAVNPDGTLKWMYVGGGASSSPTIGVDGTIYLIEMSSDGPGVPGYLSAVNPNGTRKWTGEAKALNVAPATGDDGTIYAGPGGTATMYAVNPDGTTKWQLNLCGGGSELAIGADGTIYAGFSDCDGQPSLKAINSSSNGLAKSSWPMFMHDARHTGRAEKMLLCDGKAVTIEGTDGPDKISGTDGPDVIHGLGGNDIIQGLGGDDTICGGDGHDVIGAGSGNDIVLGGNGHDAIWGGSGDDTLRGGDGNDSIYGGPGDDSLHGNHGNDSLYGISGSDELYGGWGPNSGSIDNNDTCYDTASTFTKGCEVFYEQ